MESKKGKKKVQHQHVPKSRKISLPTHKIQSKLSVEELRNRFKRQLSLPKEKDVLPLHDPMSKAQDSMQKVRGKTGIIFNQNSDNHYCLWDDKYPENPERLTCILKRCKELDLFSLCKTFEPVIATQEYINTLHTKEHFNVLESSSLINDAQEFENLSSNYDSIYINSKTFDASMAAAGSTLELMKQVIDGNIHNGMALVRPPGHHATDDKFVGYCMFNNVALAAKYAVDEMGLKRVLIVDWDVHHGQATQQMFYDDSRVLYFSSHRYEHGEFWPHLRESNYDFIGQRDGIGYNFNIPLNETGLKNQDFLAYFHQILLPVAYEFNPELVLVSAGFDSAYGCPEFMPELVIVSAGFDSALGDWKGCMEISPAFFAHMTSMLMNLAEGKMLVVLEGGYCVESLSESAMHTLRALMGYPCPRLLDSIGATSESMRESILNVIASHKPYWKSLAYQDVIDGSDIALVVPNLHTPTIIFKEVQSPLQKFETKDCYPVHLETKMEEILLELQRLKTGTDLCSSPHRLCLIYDKRMENHVNVADKSYPERPARIQEIMRRLLEFGILDRVHLLTPRIAKIEELELVHSPKLTSLILKELPSLSNRDRKRREEDFDSIYFHQDTPEAATLAAGCLLEVVDSVCEGKSQSGLAVIRPPGHHAEKQQPYGFCIFNNVAVAARYAQVKHNIHKILIVDWDVHHGNGIQHMFESDPNVLYISIHVYKNANFFPYSCEANSDFVGKGDAKGFNINIPWNKSGMGDGEYLSVFSQILLPIAYQFAPDLVFVSAGFDAAVNDPLGGCLVTPECYGHMTRLLSTLANGRIILALEGGYNVASVSYCMVMCAKALLGDPIPSLKCQLVPNASAVETIKEVIEIQKEYWTCLCFQATFPKTRDLRDSRLSKESSVDSNSEFLTPPQSPERFQDTKIMERSLSEDTQLDLVKNFQNLNMNSTTFSAVPSSHNTSSVQISSQSTFNSALSNNPDQGNELLANDTSGNKLILEQSSTSSKSEEASKGVSAPEESIETLSEGVTDVSLESLEGAVGGCTDTMSSFTLGRVLDDQGQEMYAVVPLTSCPHLCEVLPLPSNGLNAFDPCIDCHSYAENWVCLSCYMVFCGRFVEQHMVVHNLCSNHPMVLSYADLSVWCYGCESYVDNKILNEAKDSAYLSKFQCNRPS